MQKGFRYTSQKHNDALLALGNVRIGTLHDFRRTEHKWGIADSNEGTKTVSHFIPHVTDKHEGSIHLKAIKQFNAIDISGATNVTISNVELVQRFNHPDCFVHCLSASFSTEVLQQFEGADSCAEIHDLQGFYQRLTETLNLHWPVRLLSISKVFYMRREENWNGRDWGVHPALIKEAKFSRQVEIRAIWQPRIAAHISPIILNDIELVRFCSARELPGPISHFDR